MNIKVLDCTLRDGGYINDWNFKDENIIEILSSLDKSNVDILECGFLDKNSKKDNNCTRFNDIKQINSILKRVEKNNSLYVVMIELGKFDLNLLPNKKDSELDGIRFSFRKSDLKEALLQMKIIVDKGYKLFIQPISTNNYQEIELVNLIQETNALCAYAIYIVDTQGSMFKDDFRRLYYLFNQNLDKNISIGFHSHNNMQLSYSIAIDFIEIARFRQIIIDSSIYGMGRGAGNLNTELLTDYINKKVEEKYEKDYILGLIDSYFYSLYQEHNWGYSLAHFLSASLECHPNYASFLLNKKHLNVNEIKKILQVLPEKEKFEFNKKIIEKVYIEFNGKKRIKVNEPLLSNKKILILGSGKNLNEKIDYIKNNKERYILISLNHVPENIDVDYIFFNSEKRFYEFKEKINNSKVITTSNLSFSIDYVIEFEKASLLEKDYNDNSAIMLINYLQKTGIKQVELAGIDGFDKDLDNYNYQEFDKIVDIKAIEELNAKILNGLKILSKKIDIKFLTNSIFKSKLKQKIIGVIPSRYGSTRLPGKQLLDICGLPMVIHVMKRAMSSDILDEVIVATDDERIVKEVERYGGKAMMTALEHHDGTSRMYEISKSINGDIFVLINGDEPLVEPKHIEESVQGLINSKRADASVLITPYEERNNTTNLKVVINRNDEVMFISRSDIPSDAREIKKPMWKAFYIVSYWKEFLDKFVLELEETELNQRETTDQNKILEYGYTLQAVKTKSKAISVDTQEDLEKVRDIMKKDKEFLNYKDKS